MAGKLYGIMKDLSVVAEVVVSRRWSLSEQDAINNRLCQRRRFSTSEAGR
ncbi:MAG: hypothetical protein ACLS36_05630 [Streptococcus sp.]